MLLFDISFLGLCHFLINPLSAFIIFLLRVPIFNFFFKSPLSSAVKKLLAQSKTSLV